jgi:hypothetical protein
MSLLLPSRNHRKAQTTQMRREVRRAMKRIRQLRKTAERYTLFTTRHGSDLLARIYAIR